MPTQIYKTKDGKRVTGVTTIISGNLGWSKNALMYWAWNEGIEGRNYRDTSQKAADIGTIAHAMIEADLKGRKYDSSIIPADMLNKAENAYLAWLEWKDIVGFDLLGSELALVSEEYHYGGCLDIAAIKKVPCIVDLKTSGGVYGDHLIQIAAYGNLYNEHHPDAPIQGYYLLRLGKEDASFHYHYWPTLPEAWEAFKCLLTLHQLKSMINKQV